MEQSSSMPVQFAKNSLTDFPIFQSVRRHQHDAGAFYETGCFIAVPGN